MSSIVDCRLIDFWITEYARDCMLSCFQNFELEKTNEISSLIHGKCLLYPYIKFEDYATNYATLTLGVPVRALHGPKISGPARPGPAQQDFSPARPGPLMRFEMRPGPTRLIKSPTRPGPNVHC